MKKFLSKKPVMIVFIVAAVIFLAVEIGILVRPVSYGLNYTHKEDGVTTKMNIKSDSTMRMTMIEGDDKIVMEAWIYRDGHDVQMIGVKKYVKYPGVSDEEIDAMNETCMTKAEYKAEVKELKELKKESKTLYEAAMADAMEVGIFEAGDGNNVAKNVQAIVFVSVHGAITVALMVFAGLAIAYAVKKK